VKVLLAPDGSVKLPPEVLEALGAEPGDTIRLFVDRRRKSVRLERFSEDPWADALREGPARDIEDLLSDQKKRQSEAEDLFDKKLRETDGGKPDDDPDKWR